MKASAIYVNIGRGTTTDQEALIEALKAMAGEGEDEHVTGTLRIGGASLECVRLPLSRSMDRRTDPPRPSRSVTTPEPLPSSSELYTLPNVVLTPHMSGLSRLYFHRAADVLKQNAARVSAGRGGLNAFRGRGEDD